LRSPKNHLAKLKHNTYMNNLNVNIMSDRASI
jgi:hypothetical protein